MVYNSMYPIGTRPYVQRDNRKLVKRREDEESSNFSYASESQKEQEERQITQYTHKSGQQELMESKQAQQNATISYNNNLKNSSVNIAQIIKDFKATAATIGTPDDLTEEVNSYLNLIELQVKKDEPNVKVIKSNLKNASAVLDSYITETLQRPSNVVENWIDALFLQKINYKFDNKEINPLFLVKFPDGKPLSEVDESEEIEENSKSTESDEETSEEAQTNTGIPEDSQLKSLFLQAKKYAYAGNPQKAMEIFQSALGRAKEVNDSETESKILFEIGNLYDKNDYLAQALTSYDKSLKITSDNNLKTKAHYSMAQIYDDVAQFDPAMNHYMSSISYAGQSENFTAQSGSLTKIGNMYSQKYNKEAFSFYTEAKNMAEESKDAKTKGYVSNNMAGAYAKFNEPQHALKSYAEAAKDYKESESPLKVAKTYQSAAEVMQNYGNPQKAKSLLQKALASAVQAGNTQLIAEINKQLAQA